MEIFIQRKEKESTAKFSPWLQKKTIIITNNVSNGLSSVDGAKRHKYEAGKIYAKSFKCGLPTGIWRSIFFLLDLRLRVACS